MDGSQKAFSQWVNGLQPPESIGKVRHAAALLGISRQQVNNIISGRNAVSAAVANLVQKVSKGRFKAQPVLVRARDE